MRYLDKQVTQDLDGSAGRNARRSAVPPHFRQHGLLVHLVDHPLRELGPGFGVYSPGLRGFRVHCPLVDHPLLGPTGEQRQEGRKAGGASIGRKSELDRLMSIGRMRGRWRGSVITQSWLPGDCELKNLTISNGPRVGQTLNAEWRESERVRKESEWIKV